jgi:hypothetical protein
MYDLVTLFIIDWARGLGSLNGVNRAKPGMITGYTIERVTFLIILEVLLTT